MTPMISRVRLVCNATNDINGGVAGVTNSLHQEFEELGLDSKTIYLEKHKGIQRQAQLLARPFAIARFARHSKPDVLDVSGGDIWVAANKKSVSTLFVARSHGLEHHVNEIFLDSVKQGKAKKSPIHGLYHGGYHLWEVAQSLKRADVTFMLNDYDKHYAVEKLGLSEERVEVVDNGIRDSLINEGEANFLRPLEQTDAIRLAFIGSYIERKGVSYLAHALNRIFDREEKISVSFIGTGSETSIVLNDYLPQHHNRIRIIPKFENSNIGELLQQHHILVFPSLAEGFGIAVLEAMACGLAPIVTEIPGIADRLQHGVDSLLIPPRDSAAIEDALLRLSANRSMLIAIREAAYQRAKDFTWKSVAARQLTLYEKHRSLKAMRG